MDALTEFLGYFALLIVGAKVFMPLLRYFYCAFLSSPLNVKKMGQWALVTGSTDGIGRAYAEALAKKGLDIILVSRTPFKLQNVAADIENKFKVRTKIIDIDFCGNVTEYTQRLHNELSGLEIGVLINNVGMSYDYPEEFLSLPNGGTATDRIIKCNILSMDTLIRILLPSMVERRKGVIVNISSLSGMYASPLLALYSASKAYVDFFTRALEQEYSRKGITIQCVLPGYVASKMSKIRKPTLFAPSPEIFVTSSLKKLGVQSRTTGYWVHEIITWALDLLPLWLQTKIIFGNLRAIRSRFLKKKSR